MNKQDAIDYINKWTPNGKQNTHAELLVDNIYEFIASLEQQNTALQQERANMQATHQSTISQLQARIKELEEEYSKQEYRFSCVLDNATGGKASKTNINLDMAYKLIGDTVIFWVNSAVEELKELEKPKTCKSCEYIKWSSPLNQFVCKEGVSNDISKLGCRCITMPSIFNCSLYEPKDTQ